jgi:CheY-like chemotaxis protein/MinD-like ATPase involved in chromosome partitioning or flagellar assembly
VPELKVLLVEPEAKTAAFIRQALVQAGYQVLHTPSGKESLIHAWRDQPDAIVLELTLPDIDGLEVVTKLRRDQRTARKPIFGLTTRTRPEDMKAGREAGLTEYILKQSDAIQVLLQALTRELRREAGMPAAGAADPVEHGRLLVFLSANGGAGTSSLCLNVAFEMARMQAGRSVAVVDLVLPIGSLARITGSAPKPDLVDLTQLPPTDLTSDYLRRSLPHPRSWGVQLVPGAADPGHAASLQADHLAPLVQALRATYPYVLVDVGRSLSRLTMIVLTQAHALAVVLSPESTPLANTQSLLKYLEAEEIPPERFFTISNRPMLSHPDKIYPGQKLRIPA